MFKYILTLLLSSNLALAECKLPVSYLEEGKPAQCSGYLFTPEKEQEVRSKVSNYNTLQQIVDKQDQLINVMDLRVRNQMEQNILLNEQLRLKEKEDFWQKAGFFLLGAVLTGLVAYGTVQAVR